MSLNASHLGSTALHSHIAQAIGAAGGWIGFDRFMALALYAPEGGYYAGGLPKFGSMPSSGSAALASRFSSSGWATLAAARRPSVGSTP